MKHGILKKNLGETLADGIQINKRLVYGIIALIVVLAIGTYALPALKTPDSISNNASKVNTSQTGIQELYVRARSDGTYDKSELTVQKGALVRLHFSADSNAGCGRQFVIYGLNVQAVSRNGEESIIEFTPTAAGSYEYNCGMRMWRAGRLIVV